MARNEKIAEKMGWIKYFGDEPVITDSGHKVSFQFIRTPDGDIDFDLKIDTQTAHLLIERMVGDGWSVFFSHFCKTATMSLEDPEDVCAGKVRAVAETESHSKHGLPSAYSVLAPDFPTAVVELFCKVYGIRED